MSKWWLLLLCLLPGAAVADTPPDAHILKDVVRVQVEANGTYTTEEEDVIALATDSGVARFGSLERIYNTDTTEMEVIEAGTIDDAGTLHPVPSESIHDQVVPEVRNDPYYSRLHRLTISYPHAGPGTTVMFHIKTHHTHPLWGGQVWESSYLEDTVPVKDSLFEVSFPVGHAMSWHGLGSMAGVAPETEVADGRQLWRWHVQDVPAMVEEPGMPSTAEVANRVQVSSTASWDALQHTFALAWDAATDPTDVDTSSYLAPVSGLRGEALLTALVREIQDRTTETTVSISPTDWPPLPLEEAVRARRLTPEDRTVLLIGLLRASHETAVAGLTTDSDSGEIDRSFPTAEALSHVVAAVDSHLVDLADEAPGLDLPEARLAGQSVLLLNGTSAVWTHMPLPTASANRETVRMEAELDSSGRLAELVELTQYGMQNGWWRDLLQHASRDDQRDDLTTVVQQIAPQAVLKSYYVPPFAALANPVHEELTMELEPTEHHLPMLPQWRLAELLPNVGAGPRRYPTVVGCPLVEEHWLHLVVPEGQQVQPLADVSRDNAVGSYQLTCNVHGRDMWVLSRLTIKSQRVPPDQYPLFVDLVQTALQTEATPLSIAAGPTAAGGH